MSANKISNLFITVSKENYKSLVGIDKTDENYYKIAFISDGSGIITHGILYVNSPYFVEIVDTLPAADDREADTIYMVKE